MKLKNKKTGEIVKIVGYVKTGDDRMFFRFEDDRGTYKKEYNSLAELNEEWEDYEEPEEVWYIDWQGNVRSADSGGNWEKERSIGNYFETKEEAEKAVEKLKAWKRLKEKGICFYGWRRNQTGTIDLLVRWEDVPPLSGFIEDDLNLLFGGE